MHTYAKTGFISLSLAVYQFLVYDIGKKSYKIHSGIEKTTPRFLSYLRIVFTFILHRVVYLIFKI